MAAPNVNVAPAAKFFTGTAITTTTAHPTSAPIASERMGQRRYTGGEVHIRLEGRGTACTGTFALYGYDASGNAGAGGWYHIADLNGGASISIATQPNAYVDADNCNYKEKIAVDGASQAYRVRCKAISAATTWTPAYGAVKG